MSERHASLYLVSRLAAAVLNLVSVAVFTRLATTEVYGGYLVGFATSFIVFGTLFQWLLHAHFGRYAPASAARLAGALAACLAAIGAACLVLLLIAISLNWIPQADGLGMAVLVLGFVVHIAAVEMGRARLLVMQVTAAGLLRGVLMLGLGSLVLLLIQSAPLLLAAIGLAQIIATVPLILALCAGGLAKPDPADIRELIRYGWPLVPALGAAALAMNLDRIVLERLSGAAAVGTYGAVSDVVRQGFVVLGEAIAAAYMSQAKATSDAGARATILTRAFITLWTVVLFGCLSWLILGQGVLSVLLAPGYADQVHAILPFLVLGTASLVLRAYYFGQVIYFAGTVRRELIASLAMLAIAIAGAALLVPRFGATGAAASFALAQVCSLAVFLHADRITRLMPVDLIAAGQALAWCSATAVIALVGLWLNWWLAAAIILGSALVQALRWNLFDSAGLLAQLLARRAPSSRRQ